MSFASRMAFRPGSLGTSPSRAAPAGRIATAAKLLSDSRALFELEPMGWVEPASFFVDDVLARRRSGEFGRLIVYLINLRVVLSMVDSLSAPRGYECDDDSRS